MTVRPQPTSAAIAPSAEKREVPMLAKIVATIGPASDSPEVVRKLIDAGVGIFRFNFSHGDFAAHKRRLDVVRKVAQEMGRPIACLGDLQGPKIRVGKVPDGGIEIKAGTDIIFRRGIALAMMEHRPGSEAIAVFPTTYEGIFTEVEPGQKVLINDGAIRTLAVELNRDKGELRCRVMVGGLVTSGKGINLPQTDISAPAISDRDWECVGWAVEQGMDFLALSFVRTAEEVLELKERLAGMCPIDRNAEHTPDSPWIPVISKIEKPEALANIDAIVQASDAIMVARGDLGVEMDIARVPVAQKEIIAAAAAQGKPCIVATQMLETMIESAVPTRAEASDVANAIFDGADAVMLSAETATGKHPPLVVETMRRIVQVAEARLRDLPQAATPPIRITESHSSIAALAHGAWHIAHDIRAAAIVCWSEHGGTARYLSQNGFTIPIVAWSSNPRVTRRMAILGGVLPVWSPAPTSGRLIEWAGAVDHYLITRGLASAGDMIVLLAGEPLGRPKTANAVAVHRVGTTIGGTGGAGA
jgi:pyruvate kinase